MSKRMTGWALAVVLLGATSVQAQSGVDLVGCYALEVGPWAHDDDGVVPAENTPPALFELRDSTGERDFERGRKIVRPLIPQNPNYRGTPSGFWERVGDDSVRVLWTNGFAGAELRLDAAGDTMTGTARVVVDVWIQGQERPRAEALAWRVECERRS